MDTIGFPTYLEFMRDERKSRCIDTDADLFIIVAGPERSGKSLVVMATGIGIDPTYDIDKIFYDGKKYTDLLLEAARSRGLEYPRELIEKHNIMKLNLEEFLNPEKAKNFPPGTVLHYDEAGAGMSNRERNIDQYKTLQCMGHLRMVNFWCAPKLRVIDIYAREERVKFFMWVDNLGTKSKSQRLMFIYFRDSLNRMLVNPYWMDDMKLGTKYMVKKYRPDLRVYIPNLLSGDDPYIPKEIFEAYKIRKLMYDYKRLKDTQPDIPQGIKPGKNESFAEYKKRTGLGKSTYYKYRKEVLSVEGNLESIIVK